MLYQAKILEKRLPKTQNADDEESRIKEMDDIDTFKKIFDV